MWASFPSAVEPLVSKVYPSRSREGRDFCTISPFRGRNFRRIVAVLGLCGTGAVRLRSGFGLFLGRLHDRREARDVLSFAGPHHDHALGCAPGALDVVD